MNESNFEKFFDVHEAHWNRQIRRQRVPIAALIGSALAVGSLLLVDVDPLDDNRLETARRQLSDQYGCLDGSSYDITPPQQHADLALSEKKGTCIATIIPSDAQNPNLHFQELSNGELRFSDHVTAGILIELGCQNQSLYGGT